MTELENRQDPDSWGQNRWTELIPEDQWEAYLRVIHAAREKGLTFAVGGAFAVATYTGRWRNTKDLDIYVLPENREAMIEVVTGTGMVDYFDTLPYVREWIFRAHESEVIVDIIWAMANDRAQVDETWLLGGPQIEVRGETLHIVPPEEIIWAKLYVLQKDRCDWPDIFNMFSAIGEDINWEHLITRLDQDWPVLSSALAVFRWLSPIHARTIPGWVWSRLQLPEPQKDPSLETVRYRVHLLDTRPWFRPLVPEDEEPQ